MPMARPTKRAQHICKICIVAHIGSGSGSPRGVHIMSSIHCEMQGQLNLFPGKSGIWSGPLTRGVANKRQSRRTEELESWRIEEPENRRTEEQPMYTHVSASVSAADSCVFELGALHEARKRYKVHRKKIPRSFNAKNVFTCF